jgi:hypothetical protein
MSDPTKPLTGLWTATTASKLTLATRSADYLYMPDVLRESRAVDRAIEPGNTANCAACGSPVKFTAKSQLRQVIANVYDRGTWRRVEHFHAECYGRAGQPYGDPG